MRQKDVKGKKGTVYKVLIKFYQVLLRLPSFK